MLSRCIVDGCTREAISKGYCKRHYEQMKRCGKILTKPSKMKHKEDILCKVPECSNIARSKGYCQKHYRQISTHGRLTPELERGRERVRIPSLCTVEDCNGVAVARGYCNKHYLKVWRKENNKYRRSKSD